MHSPAMLPRCHHLTVQCMPDDAAASCLSCWRTMVSKRHSGVSGSEALVLTMRNGIHPALLYSLQ